MKGIAFALIAASFLTAGCHRNTREESTADKVEEKADDASDATKDAVEDAGDKVEQATDN